MGDDGPSITIFIPQYTIFCKRVHIYIYIYIHTYIYIPSGPQVLRWPHTGCCPAADDHVVSCSATGRGGVGGGVGLGVLSFVECWSRFWCSAADDHVVSCSATGPGRGGAGWGGVGCIILRGMLITLLMLRVQSVWLQVMRRWSPGDIDVYICTYIYC